MVTYLPALARGQEMAFYGHPVAVRFDFAALTLASSRVLAR